MLKHYGQFLWTIARRANFCYFRQNVENVRTELAKYNTIPWEHFLFHKVRKENQNISRVNLSAIYLQRANTRGDGREPSKAGSTLRWLHDRVRSLRLIVMRPPAEKTPTRCGTWNDHERRGSHDSIIESSACLLELSHLTFLKEVRCCTDWSAP